MKQALFLLACCLLWITPSPAQIFQGIILDQNNKTPIEGASVFFDGTSMYTTTDAQGRFSLPFKQKINTTLMVSHVAYETLSFPYPYSDLPDSLLMQEKILTFQPIVVSLDAFSRNQKMNVFRRQFLGETLAGKSCEILNEDDIQLTYNTHDNTLYATSEQPIIVSNKYLKYTISYNLESFFMRYSRKSLSENYMLSYYICGSSSFADEAPGDSIAIKRRNQTYERSYTCFFRDLIQGKLNQQPPVSHFRVAGNKTPIMRIGDMIDLTDSLEMHAVHVHAPREMLYDTLRPDGRKVYGQMLVMFKKSVASLITYLNPVFLLDDFGNFDNRSGIFFDGDMARQRVGDMLPRDYQTP